MAITAFGHSGVCQQLLVYGIQIIHQRITTGCDDIKLVEPPSCPGFENRQAILLILTPYPLVGLEKDGRLTWPPMAAVYFPGICYQPIVQYVGADLLLLWQVLMPIHTGVC